MRRTQASQTAMGTAALRAIESEKPAIVRICFDPFARRFVDDSFYREVKLLTGLSNWITGGGSAFVVCRSRYIDDYLQECLRAGTRQLVILGAGLDSRAYRGDLLKGELKVFEIDHPATQADKVARVRKVFGSTPAHVVYVPIDFTREGLERLLSSGFDSGLKTLFIWEGVTLYLEDSAVDATLTWVRMNASPGSTMVFDYQDTSTLTKPHLGYAALNRLTGEKRVFGLERGQIGAFLTQRGFARIVDLSAVELKEATARERTPDARWQATIRSSTPRLGAEATPRLPGQRTEARPASTFHQLCPGALKERQPVLIPGGSDPSVIPGRS